MQSGGMEIILKIIARIHNGFQTKFGIPRQSGLASSLRSVIVFEPEYRDVDAIRGIEAFSHLWLIWGFDRSHFDGRASTVRPPRLGGNTRVGVFATRSPNRPNPIGLSCVRLASVDHTSDSGPTLVVYGADMIDGTPIYDIKPYIPYADCHPEAVGGYADVHSRDFLEVSAREELLADFPSDERDALFEILRQDPRPGYHEDSDREYGFCFAGFDIRFTVSDGILTLTDIIKLN